MKDKELEIGYINCILQEPDLLDDTMDKVDIYDFTDDRREMFKIIQKQYNKTGNLSRTKFYSEIKDLIDDDITKLFDSDYVFTIEINDIVEKLNNLKLRRQLRKGLIECYDNVKDNELSSSQLKSAVENIILEITGDKETNKIIKQLEEVAMKSFEGYSERRERQQAGKEIDRLKTYYPSLDMVMEGFKPGHLTILAGATSSGKTAFAVNIMRNILKKCDKPVYFISLEMKDKELFDRILIQESRVSASDYSIGDVNEGQHKNINHSFNSIHDKQALITDKAGLNIDQIKSLSRRANKYYQDGIGLIIIDYLTMIKMEKLDNYKTIGKVATDIRDLAKELNVSILLLHQLNRDLHKRSNNKPKLSDLRDSGELEERADEVLFVHRPEYFQKKESGEEEEKVQKDAEIIVAKNRTGKTGSIVFTWYPEILTFQDGYLFENNGPIEYYTKGGQA